MIDHGANVTSDIAPSPAPRQRRVGILFGLTAAVIWGGFLTVSGHGIAVGLSATDLAFIRYTVAGVLLLPWLMLRSRRTLAQVGWRRVLALVALVGPLFIVVGASGYRFAPVAHGAVIQPGMLTVAGILLAAVCLGERPRANHLLGLAILLAGLAMIAGPGLVSGTSQAWIGDLLFATAGTMFAAFTVLVRRWRIEALAATASVSVVSAILYAPPYLLVVGTGRLASVPTAILVEQVVVQGILSGILALFAFGRAIALLGAGRASLFPALTPAVAVMIGIPLVGEVPTAGQWAGLLLATTGLVTALAKRSGGS